MRFVASAFLLTIFLCLPANAAVTVSQPAAEPAAKDLGPPRGVCVGTEDECKAKKKNENPDEKSGRLVGTAVIAC